jgi:hypothetical protein
MKVNGRDTGPIPPGRPVGPRAEHPPQNDRLTTQKAEKVAKLDRVEISSAGRARSDALAPVPSSQPDRLEEVRRRLLASAYDSDDVIGEVARRILDRGDV